MTEQGRPILVWLIPIYFVCTMVAWVFFASLLGSDTTPLGSTQAGMNEVTPFDFMSGFLSALFYLIAAITLFFMRKMALYLFAGAVCLELALLIFGLGSRTEVMMLGGDSETIILTVSIAISVFLCIYVFLLNMSGRLR